MSGRVWMLRAALVAVGVAAVGFGVFTLVTTIAPAKLAWLVVWLAATVVIHDGILVPALSVARARLRATGRGWPVAVTATIEIGFLAFATVALFVAPELWAQQRGNANPTILQGDYAGRLVGLAVVIGAVVLVVSRVLMARARRRARE